MLKEYSNNQGLIEAECINRASSGYSSKHMNPNAKEFQPANRVQTQLRANAAEFVPNSTTVAPAVHSLGKDIASLASITGVIGVNVSDIPELYIASQKRPIDLTGSADLSSLLRSIPERIVERGFHGQSFDNRRLSW
jgi:hypothetical protein